MVVGTLLQAYRLRVWDTWVEKLVAAQCQGDGAFDIEIRPICEVTADVNRIQRILSP